MVLKKPVTMSGEHSYNQPGLPRLYRHHVLLPNARHLAQCPRLIMLSRARLVAL